MKAVHEGIIVDNVKKYLIQITKWGNTTLGHMRVCAVFVTKAVHEGILADDVNTGRLQRNILLRMKRQYMKVSLQ